MKMLLTLSAITFALSGLIGHPVQSQDADAVADVVKNVSGVEIPELPEFNRDDDVVYGKQIAEYVDSFDTGWTDAYEKSTMTLFDAGGDSVERKVTRMLLEKNEGDKAISRFDAPAEIKGVAALVHEKPEATDDNWLYLPSSKRVRRISGANRTSSFQGTEFTYEDLSTLIVSKYDWKFLEDATLEVDGATESVYKVEAKPNYEDTGYSKIVVYYNSKKWRVERIDYYDKGKKLLKVSTNQKWEHYHGRFWRSNSFDMDNKQTKKRTELEVKTRLLNLSLYTSKKTGKPRKNLDDEHFTVRALEK